MVHKSTRGGLLPENLNENEQPELLSGNDMRMKISKLPHERRENLAI